MMRSMILVGASSLLLCDFLFNPAERMRTRADGDRKKNAPGLRHFVKLEIRRNGNGVLSLESVARTILLEHA